MRLLTSFLMLLMVVGVAEANVQGQAQGQASSVSVSEGGDDNYSFAPPGLSANRGVSELNAYSIFGGVGLSEDQEYVLMVERIALVERLRGAGFITDEEAKEEARDAYEQFKETVEPKRWLGFGWKTRGRHLLNLFGLLAVEDLRFEVPGLSGKTEDSDPTFTKNFKP